MKKITLIVLLFCATFLSAQEKYNIKNISSNTKYSDFGVSYYGESNIIFASARKGKAIENRIWSGNKQPFLELYKGDLSNDGEIINIEQFSKTINTKFHESNVAFTKDLKLVYFTRNNYLNNKFKKDSMGWNLNQLYRAKIGNDGKWTDIQAMPFNSDNYQTGHPALNDKEDKLYFISDMPGSIGLTDIYVVDIYADGTYGEPVNLGDKINTVKSEMFPYIDTNDVLYYSSNGFEDSKGGLDIYATKLRMNTNYYNPKNLEYPINSDKDDFGIVFQKNTKIGYFSSNRNGGKGDDDIYSFNELSPVKFECYEQVQGLVKDGATGDLLSGALVVLYGSDGNKIENVISDNYAKFSFKTDCDSSYKIIALKDNYRQDSIEFISSKEINVELNLAAIPKEFVTLRGKLMVSINPIYFDLDKSDITKDAAIELEKVVGIMKKYTEIKLNLGSYTDSRAPDKYNWNLSNRRAKSTIDWILNRGIDASRITGKGYGETQLVNKCADGVKCSEAEHQLNRRTEFVVVNPEVIK